MVRSRKNALVTAIIALILVAAVVLAVVFLGDGAIYTPGGQEATASNAAVTVGSTVGTVGSDYMYTTLVAHSNKKNSEWTASDMQDLRGVDGNAGADGVPDTYVTTLDTNFFLITQDGWNSVNAGQVPGGGSGYYELQYNGVWYRFNNGNGSGSGAVNASLYQSYATFMDTSTFYQNSSVYGLILTDIEYNPNDFAANHWFNATLDGAGHTLSMNAVLNYNTSDWAGDNNNYLYWLKGGIGHNQMNRVDSSSGGGAVFAGLVFGGLCDGEFKNFTVTEKENVSGTHTYSYTSSRAGSAFGGLVGAAAPASAGGTARSSIYNIALNFTQNITHQFTIDSYNAFNKLLNDIYTGGLVGVNFNADIELVSLNYNGILFTQKAPRGRNYNSGGASDYWCQSSMGGVVGAQFGVYNENMTFSKVSITGQASSGFLGDVTEATWGSGGVSYYNNIFTQMGLVFGALEGDLSIEGLLLDYNYDNIYAKWDASWGGARDSTSIQRGLLAGHIYDSQITYSDIYVSDKLFSLNNNSNVTIDALGSSTPQTISSSNVAGSQYTTYYTYIGGHDTVNNFNAEDSIFTTRSFTYVQDNVISVISFSDQSDKMVQITAPTKQKGVMWDITYTTSGGGQHFHEDLFTQNARSNVHVSSVGAPSNTSHYLTMSISYASSYTFDVTNGPNGDGSSTKYYDGEQVNFPALSLNIPSQDYIMSTGTQYTDNGYITISRSGARYQLNFNNGSVAVGAGISNIYNSSGTKFGNDFNSVVSTVLKLEAVQNGEYAVIGLDSWSAQNQVNSYRWSSLSLFAMQDSSGNKYVFAPSNVVQAQQAQVDIDQRPIYIKVNQDSKNVPYIGNSYNIASGTSAPAGNVYYTFGTTANDGHGAIIGNDLVSLGSFTLTKDSASVSVAQDAGAYTINVNELLGGSRNNYQLVAAPDSANTFTINPASVTLTVTGGSATYGFTKPADAAEFMSMVDLSFTSSNSSLTGFASRDGITVNMNIQTGDSASAAGQWLITPAGGATGSVFEFNFPAGEYEVQYQGITGTGVSNYNVTFANDTPFVINKAPLAVTLPAISDFVYGGDPVVGEPTYPGLLSTDTIPQGGYYISYMSNGAAYEQTNFVAGSYTAQAIVTAINSPGSDAGINNYDLQPNTQAFDVSKRDTAVQFNYDQSELIYKGSAYTFTATDLTNPAFGDEANLDTKVTFQAYSDVNRQNKVDATNAGTYYPGAVSEALSANYNVTGVLDANGDEWTSFEVLKATITVNAKTQTIEYSGSEVVYDTSNVTIEGEVSGEEELIRNAISILYNGSSAVPVDAGTYSVTVQIDGLANYNAVNVTLNDIFKINPMTVHIVVTKAQNGQISAVYSGANIPAIAYTVQNDEGTEITEATL